MKRLKSNRKREREKNLLEFGKEHFAFIILFNPQNNPETGVTIFNSQMGN